RVAPVVLTPAPHPPSHTTAQPILTIGSLHDVDALRGWRGRVVVKLQSSMHRFGATPEELPSVLAAASAAGLEVVGNALHLPQAGSDADRLAEVGVWLTLTDPLQPVWLSHLQPQSFATLRAAHSDRQFRLRVGTALWHGDKSFLQLNADVLAVHHVHAGDTAGYRLTAVPGDGHLALISAGSAHGVAPLPDGSSPFHFARTRLALFEPPHMHTSMVFVPTGSPYPAVGERVDVQRPLISTMVDEVEWM
ncbi:MAG: alanine racemase, partial [Ilumatobacteraceae bacterium]